MGNVMVQLNVPFQFGEVTGSMGSQIDTWGLRSGM